MRRWVDLIFYKPSTSVLMSQDFLVMFTTINRWMTVMLTKNITSIFLLLNLPRISTLVSQTVTLVTEIRELVYSRRYDANRMTGERNGLYIHMVLGKNDQKGPLIGLRV